MPLLCRKIQSLFKKPIDTIKKLAKGFFFAVAWMTMATWGVLALLCHFQKHYTKFSSDHRHGALVAIFLGPLMVGIDYAYRV